MFETDQQTVDELLLASKEFRRLFDKHTTLKSQIRDVGGGVGGMGQLDLETMKKEKLLLKDQMATMIKNHRSAHV